MKVLGILLLLLSTTFAHASILAIIDSGTDIQHNDISSQVWKNPIEIPDNNRDEDKNGYQDDVYGWNFAESNNQVIDYSYLILINGLSSQTAGTCIKKAARRPLFLSAEAFLTQITTSSCYRDRNPWPQPSAYRP